MQEVNSACGDYFGVMSTLLLCSRLLCLVLLLFFVIFGVVEAAGGRYLPIRTLSHPQSSVSL